MRVNVTKAFPYSEHGWDNAFAPEGVQELPDHIAAIALKEGWGVEAPADATDGTQAGEDGPDLRVQSLKADDAVSFIASIDDAKVLDQLAAGEVAHPKFPGGRPRVLRALTERHNELARKLPAAEGAKTPAGDGDAADKEPPPPPAS